MCLGDCFRSPRRGIRVERSTFAVSKSTHSRGSFLTTDSFIVTRTALGTERFCTSCGERQEVAARFCAACGKPITEGDASQSSGTIESPPPGTQQENEIRSAEIEAEPVFVPLPGTGADASPVASRRKRRRHRRPLYRKKRILIPSVAIVLLLAALLPSIYWTGSTLSTVRQVSTPPPEIMDGTFMEEDDPGMSGGPITVQTGPALAALEAVSVERGLPQHADGGLGGMWRNVSSGASDIAGGAAVATGLHEGADESFTVLVMGVDARPGSPIDIGVRPDVLMVVRFDPATQSCRALSVPRDTRVELPGYGQSKINHALMVGGIPYQILVTEDFLEIDIDHYLLIDFVAFQQIVDSVGGITVDVPEDLTRNGTLHFTEGTQDFEGEEALAYARFRSGPEADRARIERQWGVLSSIAEEMEGRDLVGQVSQVTTTVEDHLRTDLPAADMTSIAKVYGETCAAMGTEEISMMAGTWVPFDDPILGRQEVYNFVEPAVVEQHVADLMTDTPGSTEGTPSLQNTPVAPTPAGTPEPRGRTTNPSRSAHRIRGRAHVV